MTQQPGMGWDGQQGPGYGGPPPPPQQPKKRRRWPWIAGGVVLLLIVIGAITGKKDEPAPAAATSAPTTTAAAASIPPSSAPTVAPTSAQPTTTTPSATAVPPAATRTSPTPVRVPMPNVVCQNLQTAQDTIQAAGVILSRSEDGTGAGRAQVLDRNWVVTAQSPEPGVLIGEGDAVLTAVKIGEPSPC